MPQDTPDNQPHSVVDAIYRRAFPHEEGAFLLANARRGVIEHHIGIAPDGTPKQLKEARTSLGHFGFDRSMLDVLRHRSVAELALFLSHAFGVFGDDLEHRNTWQHLIKPRTAENLGGIPEGVYGTTLMQATFNRAVGHVDEDVAAIDRAILDITGKEPTRGRGRAV